jgi:hypothetical protein
MTPHISANTKRLTGVKEMKQNVDPRTGRGLRELTEAYGAHKAWSARIAALENDIATHATFNGWVHDSRHALQKQLANARFELAWLTHPQNTNA